MTRFKFEFWLDSDKDDELLLMEDIDELKQNRLFVKTIRDGIRLIMDLRRGSFDVLIELFPDIRKHIREDNGDGGGGNDDLRKQIEKLQSIILQQIEPNGLLMGARAQTITSRSFDLPASDGDFAHLIQATANDNTDDVIANFLGVVSGLT